MSKVEVFFCFNFQNILKVFYLPTDGSDLLYLDFEECFNSVLKCPIKMLQKSEQTRTDDNQ
jgi:hypothetical protein